MKLRTVVLCRLQHDREGNAFWDAQLSCSHVIHPATYLPPGTERRCPTCERLAEPHPDQASIDAESARLLRAGDGG